MTNNSVPLARPSIETFPHEVLFPVDIEHYESAVPACAEQILHTLYGSVYSSVPHFRVHGGLEGANTFILRRKQEPVAVFLYRIEGSKAKVLNEGMEIGEPAITEFSNFIFQQHRFVDVISFSGIAHTSKRLNFPFSQCFCTDDSVIPLPDSTDTYLNSLGKATRKNIKQYLNRIKRDYPTFEFHVHDGHIVDEQLIKNIIAFNRVRFEKKGKISGITELEEARIIAMLRACGIVGAISIDGKLCAGSLVYCIGDHYHSWLKAHDPAYDDYRLGLIGSFLMISDCIRRGGKTYHLMWGREPHKALLNSELRTFSNLTVYRSHAAALRNCGLLFRDAYQHGIWQGKLWLLGMGKGQGKLFYPIKAGLSGMRKLKAWLPHRS
jgi:hypothetical protein